MMDRFELSEGELHVGSRTIPLTPKERAVMRVLMESPGRVVASATLIDSVWGSSPIGTESLHRCISTLRGKLERQPGAPSISTVYGSGYRLESPAPTVPEKPAAVEIHAAEGFRQAVEVFGRRSRPDADLARKLLAQLRQDHPGFLPAFVFGAHTEISTAMLGYLGPEAAARSVRELSAAILERNPASVDALSVRGFVAAVIEGDDSGFDDLDAAVSANPEDWLSRYYRGWALAGKGAFAAAIRDFEEAQRCHGEIVGLLGGYGHVLLCSGQPERALALFREATEVAQVSPSANASHAINASLLGFHDEAIAAARRVAAVPRMSGTLLASLPFALARAGRAAEATQWLERIVAAEEAPPAPAMIAPVFLVLGNITAARAALARSAASHCPYRHIQRFDPRLASLRT